MADIRIMGFEVVRGGYYDCVAYGCPPTLAFSVSQSVESIRTSAGPKRALTFTTTEGDTLASRQLPDDLDDHGALSAFARMSDPAQQGEGYIDATTWPLTFVAYPPEDWNGPR